jgi:thioredoxin 1
LNENVVVLTGENWEREVLRSETPVLVDFWATWCAPCRMIAPVIDALANEYAGRLKVAKVDVDQNPDLAGRYNVVSIPTLLVMKGGKVVEQRIGAVPGGELKRLLEGVLSVAV